MAVADRPGEPLDGKSFEFLACKEVPVRSNPGKAEWPHTLHVQLSRYEALRIISTIAGQLERPNADAGVVITFVGELSRAE